MCSVVKFYGLLIYLLHFCSNLFNSFDTSKQGRVSLDFNQFVYCSEFLFPVSMSLLLYLALHFRWYIFLEGIEIDTLSLYLVLQRQTAGYSFYLTPAHGNTDKKSAVWSKNLSPIKPQHRQLVGIAICETRLLSVRCLWNKASCTAILLEFLQGWLSVILCQIYNNPGLYI